MQQFGNMQLSSAGSYNVATMFDRQAMLTQQKDKNKNQLAQTPTQGHAVAEHSADEEEEIEDGEITPPNQIRNEEDDEEGAYTEN